MKLLWTKKVFSNWKHNAFTDLAWFNGYYYLAFRTGKEHLCDKSNLVIMRSKDTKKWLRLTPPEISEKGDLRDPKFFMETDMGPFGMTFVLRRKNSAATYQSFWMDNYWSQAKLLRDGWVAWRSKRIGRTLLTPFYKYNEKEGEPKDWKVEIFDEGKFYELASGEKSGFRPNETELLEQDGKIYAIVRCEGNRALFFGPDKMSSFEDRLMQGVCSLKLNNRHFVSGRDMASCSWALTDPDKLDPEKYCWFQRLTIIELNLDKKQIVSELVLCSGKKIDCGYCGMVKNQEKENRRFFISYYKGAGNRADIYLAEVEI